MVRRATGSPLPSPRHVLSPRRCLPPPRLGGEATSPWRVGSVTTPPRSGRSELAATPPDLSPGSTTGGLPLLRLPLAGDEPEDVVAALRRDGPACSARRLSFIPPLKLHRCRAQSAHHRARGSVRSCTVTCTVRDMDSLCIHPM